LTQHLFNSMHKLKNGLRPFLPEIIKYLGQGLSHAFYIIRTVSDESLKKIGVWHSTPRKMARENHYIDWVSRSNPPIGTAAISRSNDCTWWNENRGWFFQQNIKNDVWFIDLAQLIRKFHF
jgi:hypothetical protein